MAEMIDFSGQVFAASYYVYSWLPHVIFLGALSYTSKKIYKRFCFLGKGEQLLRKHIKGKEVINGPAISFPSPFTTLSYKKRKGVVLSETQYVTVKNEATASTRIEKGPQILLLGAYDIVTSGPNETIVLDETQCVTVTDQKAGQRRLVHGPTTFIPKPFEIVSSKSSAVSLRKSQFIKIQDTSSGSIFIECGEQVLWLQPHHRTIGPVREAYSLKAHQEVRLRDSLTGVVRVERGERLVFPGPYEEPLNDEGVIDAIDLKAWEYCRIQDRTTGKVRVERGDQLIFLAGNDRVLGPRKQKAQVVDKTHAVLVRNCESGVQVLVQEPQLFVPRADEEIIEVREIISLAAHEAIVLKTQTGSYDIRFGDPAKGTERTFFLPPHWEIVTLMWSRGRRREKRDLAIQIFDCRPTYMSFEFNCRTSDNVEMVLEGTFFWEVQSIEDMLRFTSDAPGDVCAHARSCFIQLISKVTLQEFMETFNKIAKEAHSGDDQFYAQRGIKIHSLEVTRYACADRSTAAILEQIIAETTNRMNRLSCQESENEVRLAALRGEGEQENARSEVLAIKQKHAIESARAEGLAEAERCLAFMKAIREGDASSDDESTMIGSPKLAEELWHALRKAETLRAVATGNAHVYFTPAEANLTIENRPESSQ